MRIRQAVYYLPSFTVRLCLHAGVIEWSEHYGWLKQRLVAGAVCELAVRLYFGT